MKQITKNLFDLTKEQEQASMMMYGKVIKCLIAPYHYIKNIPLEPNNEVFVYPERDLDIQQRKEIVSVMANSPKDEIRFVTSDVFIIRDMIDGCCRILTPKGELEAVQEKTFAANHHTILHEVLHDESHVKTKQSEKEKLTVIINQLITDLQKGQMTQEEYDRAKSIIKTIGEPVIVAPLKNMLAEVKIISSKYVKNDFTGSVEFTAEEIAFVKDKEWFKKNLHIKECLQKCREGAANSRELIDGYEELIRLKERANKNKTEIANDKLELAKAESELKIRHKIEYWLTEQKETTKIQTVFNW